MTPDLQLGLGLGLGLGLELGLGFRARLPEGLKRASSVTTIRGGASTALRQTALHPRCVARMLWPRRQAPRHIAVDLLEVVAVMLRIYYRREGPPSGASEGACDHRVELGRREPHFVVLDAVGHGSRTHRIRGDVCSRAVAVLGDHPSVVVDGLDRAMVREDDSPDFWVAVRGAIHLRSGIKAVARVSVRS